MTIYRHSFGVCSLGFNSARQMLHVVNQNNSKARLLSTKVPCQEFNNLWNSYISGTVDVTDFLEQIQIHQQDLELRHQSLTMVAVATFDRPEEYYQTIMGIFHALDCLCQVPQAASAIKLLLIGLTKTGADKFNLIKLFPEQKVTLMRVVSSLLSRTEGSYAGDNRLEVPFLLPLQPAHPSLSMSASNSESKSKSTSASMSSEEIPPGANMRRDGDNLSALPLAHSLSYRIYTNLVARALRDLPFIRSLAISPDLFKSFFGNCLAEGDLVAAKMIYESLPLLQSEVDHLKILVLHLNNKNNKQLCSEVLINRFHQRKADGLEPSHSEIKLALDLVEDCLSLLSQSHSALLVSVAYDVSTAYSFWSLRDEASILRKRATINKFLSKNHWQLALQVCNTKASQVYLYQALQKEENYIAASTVYSTFDLGSEKYLNLNLVRITDEALHAQRTREALTHLCLPEVVAQRGVILVNSMSTLREAADILGFPLQNSSSITASSASGRKSAKSLRKKNLSEFTGSSSSGSSSYSGNSSRSGNKSSNNISNNNNSSSSSGSGSNDKTSPLTRQPSLSGPSVRLYVGVDAEWKASMINSKSCPTAEPGAALLQISTPGRVLIFDLHALSGVGPRGCERKLGDSVEYDRVLASGGFGASFDSDLPQATAALLEDLFSAADVVKVGWSFAKSDLVMLRASGRGAFASSFSEVRSILELTKFTAALASTLDRVQALSDREKLFAEKFSKLNCAEYSLSKACACLLGRPLLKEEQISDWDALVLTPSQIAYAALDAHCLLGLLDSVIKGLRSAHERAEKMTLQREELSEWMDVGVDGMYVQIDAQASTYDQESLEVAVTGESIKKEEGMERDDGVDEDLTSSLLPESDQGQGQTQGSIISESNNNIKKKVKMKYRPPVTETRCFALSAWLSDTVVCQTRR